MEDRKIERKERMEMVIQRYQNALEDYMDILLEEIDEEIRILEQNLKEINEIKKQFRY